MEVENIYSGDILLDEKSYENILIYGISYKTFMGDKRLRVWFDKTDGFIEIDNRIKYLVIFGYEWCDKICNNVKYLISEKNCITDNINHNFARIRIDSYNYLPIEKKLTLHNVIILIKVVVNKDKNNYCYNIFLKNGLYKEYDTLHF